MKALWLAENGKKEFLVFFAGWGMDARPFEFLAAGERDVLVLFDYTDEHVPVDLGALAAGYETVDVAAWSLGVPVANTVCAGLRGTLRRVVAVNGSIIPVDEQFGIPPEMFDATVERLGHGGLERFRRRMCGGAETLERFNSMLPDRDLDSLTSELVALRERFSGAEPAGSIFDCAWVGANDRIIRADSQCRCWQRFGVPFAMIDAPHFPFYRWSGWEELLCPEDP